ncbi:LysR substrate-binding domain-containing protein [Amorphus orientalis]|uniref:DNA-binding transcriptional LysR family regulator n=1 Tax=Amorphus orientalis TaxID=649198 RepID=A0AAE4ARH3_9HYPH|nr:LysR substrate-binding domain-containing protein [Amorphus orientalis]MDQ0315176.1 DNA-binding transcriptional LysR family regulator [Amorphus orientalis]
MAYRLPPLASLRLFEAASRHTSFKQAADELGLTPSAVSHGIDTLETWLAVSLFERSGRSLALTEAGRDFLPYVTEGLSMIATGARRVSPALGASRIRVSVAPTFARRWLMPRLAEFRRRRPDIDLHIDTSHRQAVLPLEGVDLAIRMAAGPWPSSDCDLLFREALLPVAAPAYLDQILIDRRHVDWSKAQLIHVSSVENDWPAWLAAHGLEASGGGHLVCDDIDLALDAATEGLGVTLCRLPLCRDALDQGRVVALPFEPLPIETGYWVTVPAGREPRREIEAFRAWLREEAQSDIA